MSVRPRPRWETGGWRCQSHKRCPTNSEVQPQSAADRPLIRQRAGDPHEFPAAHTRVGNTEMGGVRQVERFRAELQLETFSQREVPENAQGRVDEAWSAQEVATCVAE